MNSKTMNFALPFFHEKNLDVDRPPLSLMRAALLVGAHVVDQRRRYDAGQAPLGETARLLYGKIQEVLCFLDAYEYKLDKPHNDAHDDIPF